MGIENNIVERAKVLFEEKIETVTDKNSLKNGGFEDFKKNFLEDLEKAPINKETYDSIIKEINKIGVANGYIKSVIGVADKVLKNETSINNLRKETEVLKSGIERDGVKYLLNESTIESNEKQINEWFDQAFDLRNNGGYKEMEGALLNHKRSFKDGKEIAKNILFATTETLNATISDLFVWSFSIKAYQEQKEGQKQGVNDNMILYTEFLERIAKLAEDVNFNLVGMPITKERFELIKEFFEKGVYLKNDPKIKQYLVELYKSIVLQAKIKKDEESEKLLQELNDLQSLVA